MTTVYGNTIGGYWRVRLDYTFYPNYSQTQARINYTLYINWVSAVRDNGDYTYTMGNDRPTYVAATSQSTQYKYPTGELTRSNTPAGRNVNYGSGSFTYNKRADAYNITLTASICHSKGWSTYKGTSTKRVSITIPALDKYTISFNGNTSDEVRNMPEPVVKSHGINITIPSNSPTRDGYAFTSWNELDDGSGASYQVGSPYGGNADATLFAQWGAVDAPICKIGDITFSTSAGNVIRSFTDISCDISDIEVFHDRNLVGVKMQIAGKNSNVLTTDGTLTIYGQENGVPTFTSADEGEHIVYIITEDDADDGHAIGTYPIGSVQIVSPTWAKEIVINTDEFPSLDADGNALLEQLQIYNYSADSWDTVAKSEIKLIDNTTTWSFNYTFDENHVDDPLDTSPAIGVRTTYKHYEVEITEGNRAFYTTTRNQNYSNGIYNVMFVGGVDNTLYPTFTSRTWWSKINDPLYFPDTNYIEVGSNDTAVQGLTKVGDYLAVVKQSKTTDTAIFLVYPTSFEEETTYAVKQGVQGVGALARYSFNILGDETLFLSTKGVMAIVPSQDEEHKVQNRSYFIDKKLLAESGVENSYSFVFDGKYFLSIGNGHCYVLDGNQRNSWGNDKTNLVYECYYLENIPANCFVKYQDKLVFSTMAEVCVFGDDFTDAYDESGDAAPVVAEWSTVLDDDGALHYNKTMQKKGNLVSVLPLENEIPYRAISIDEQTFNENKSMYYILEDGKYIQCTDQDEYSADTEYYIENRSATKVFVKKDNNEPIEIQRKFGLRYGVPSELFLNKKVKKYKRLQFILRNDADEDFGVDEIVKNYTLQNYAKK